MTNKEGIAVLTVWEHMKEYGGAIKWGAEPFDEDCSIWLCDPTTQEQVEFDDIMLAANWVRMGKYGAQE